MTRARCCEWAVATGVVAVLGADLTEASPPPPPQPSGLGRAASACGSVPPLRPSPPAEGGAAPAASREGGFAAFPLASLPPPPHA